MDTHSPNVGIYVHLPWCVRKCPYCDFNSHAVKGSLEETEYVDALLSDIDYEQVRLDGDAVATSIFFGGGTPSLFSPDAVARVLDRLTERFHCDPEVEITLEANPASSDAANFSGYRQAGVNRLSIGVQSFNDQHLAGLGRAHDGRSARKAVDAAKKAGFERINIDLMYGLSNQTPGQAVEDVEIALSLGLRHLSHYQLTLEPNTQFYHSPPVLPDEAAIDEMEQECRALLLGQNIRRYEISAYAKPGEECEHNLNYWRFGDYLGIGAGAHGKVRNQEGQHLRVAKTGHPTGFMESAGSDRCVISRRVLEPAEIPLEFMLNRARLMESFSAEAYQSSTGLGFSDLLPLVKKAEEAGLMEGSQSEWRVTPLGHRYLNNLLETFLLEPPSATNFYTQRRGSSL